MGALHDIMDSTSSISSIGGSIEPGRTFTPAMPGAGFLASGGTGVAASRRPTSKEVAALVPVCNASTTVAASVEGSGGPDPRRSGMTRVMPRRVGPATPARRRTAAGPTHGRRRAERSDRTTPAVAALLQVLNDTSIARMTISAASHMYTKRDEDLCFYGALATRAPALD